MIMNKTFSRYKLILIGYIGVKPLMNENISLSAMAWLKIVYSCCYLMFCSNKPMRDPGGADRD